MTVAATNIAVAAADEQSSVAEAWARTQESLPDGWTLDGLRCASSGLEPGQRSEGWVAVAVGPGGRERSFLASGALAALDGLAEVVSRT